MRETEKKLAEIEKKVNEGGKLTEEDMQTITKALIECVPYIMPQAVLIPTIETNRGIAEIKYVPASTLIPTRKKKRGA